MSVPDFKIPGTKLPIIPKGASYVCSRKDDKNTDKEVWINFSNELDYVSFGSIMLRETFILCENRHYQGAVYYAFKESDIISLYKEQNPEPSFPERWCIKLTEENKAEVGGYYNKQVMGGVAFNSYDTLPVEESYLRSHDGEKNGNCITDGNCLPYLRFGAPTEDFPEITIEQFREHILKQDTTVEEEHMQSKIIEYKLKSQYTTSCYDAVCNICGCNPFKTDNHISCCFAVSIKALNDAGVLDIWFEPVFEINYKLEDWVTILGIGTSSWVGVFSGAKVGDTVKIQGISHNDGPRYYGSNWNLRREDFRPATEDEIKAVLEPVLYFGKVEFKLDKINMLYTTKYGPVSLDELQNAIKYI